MVVWRRQGARHQQIAVAEAVHARNPATNIAEILAYVRIRGDVRLDREGEAIHPLPLFLELGRRQRVGGVGSWIVKHRLDPSDDAQAMLMGDRQQVLQR